MKSWSVMHYRQPTASKTTIMDTQPTLSTIKTLGATNYTAAQIMTTIVTEKACESWQHLSTKAMRRKHFVASSDARQCSQSTVAIHSVV